jgi:chromosome segregation ATPase
MKLPYSFAKSIDERLDTLVTGQATQTEALTQLRTNMDARLQKITDDLAEIKAETGQYIADRDEIDRQKDALIAAKDAEIARLAAELAAGNITIAQFNEGLDAAVVTADEAASLLPSLRPPVEPAPEPSPEVVTPPVDTPPADTPPA